MKREAAVVAMPRGILIGMTSGLAATTTKRFVKKEGSPKLCLANQDNYRQ